MFKHILASIALLFGLFHSSISTTEHNIDRTESSIVHVIGHHIEPTPFGAQDIPFSCTGFVVDNNIVLTAAHCEGDNLSMDGATADLIKDDKPLDLALYHVASSRGPVRFYLKELARFEQVYGIGYGLGLDRPMVTFNRVLWGDDYLPSADGPGHPGLFVQGGYVPGMSGGPVINSNGLVVGMVQQSNLGVGFGTSAREIVKFLK